MHLLQLEMHIFCLSAALSEELLKLLEPHDSCRITNAEHCNAAERCGPHSCINCIGLQQEQLATQPSDISCFSSLRMPPHALMKADESRASLSHHIRADSTLSPVLKRSRTKQLQMYDLLFYQ